MNRTLFLMMYTIYISFTGVIGLTKISSSQQWFTQWFFDKFFIFQFMLVVTIGLAIESNYFHNISYIRIGNRRTILKKELFSYYLCGVTCLAIMFSFIIFGALILKENNYILPLTEWFIRYFLGIIIYINIMSCLKSSKSLILSKYCYLFTLIWLVFELTLLKPYLKKFTSLDVNFIFSWIFNKGITSYYFMLVLILITVFLNIKINDKRDFI